LHVLTEIATILSRRLCDHCHAGGIEAIVLQNAAIDMRQKRDAL
jgi:hypothetical protein